MADPLRCVLVDDDPDFLQFARMCVAHICPRFEILSFRSSLEAFGYLRTHPTNLVITDYRMPDLDGVRLTRRLRAADEGLPIIVMSGDEIGAKALESGATEFLAKSDFVGRIGTALRRLGFIK